MERCCICDELTDDGRKTSVLGEKGSDSINRASEQRGSTVTATTGQSIHIDCRRVFCNEHEIKAYIRSKTQPAASTSSVTHTKLRSESPQFNFKEHCMFCGHAAKTDKRRRGYEVFPVRTMDFQNRVSRICESRNDEWSRVVYGRIISVNDLPAADAVYHQACSVAFRTGRQLPSSDSEGQGKMRRFGRPSHEQRSNAFLEVVHYLEENDEEQTTINDLVVKMAEYLDETDAEPYTSVYMKEKLKEHFGDQIIVTELNGKQNVVTFRDNAKKILYEFHQKKDDSISEQMKIIQTAAKLIQCDIKSVTIENDLYPSVEELSSKDLASDFVPETLKLFLRTVFAGKNIELKLASIGQTIMQAARPRVLLVPLHLGLGIQLHHHFASRYLIDTLNSLGFCCSYAEVKRYERSAATEQGTDIQGYTPDRHMEYVADNVDHNVATLDGSGTFHGMGIVCTLTPGSSNHKRIAKANVTSEDIAAVGRINIGYFKTPPVIPRLLYEPLNNPNVEDSTAMLDILWKSSLLVSSFRPAWSSMMQMVQHGDYPGKSSVQFLPMIDMNPSDNSCIYSTLKFVCAQAARYDTTPILTFDQPLWWKALTIIRCQPATSELNRVVLRLGGLHTEMSFLGSIGHLMAGSGLKELLEVVYASNSVTHMLSGKALSRAVRGHLLVDAALNTTLIANAYNVPVPSNNMSVQPETDDEQTPESEKTSSTIVEADLNEVRTIYDDLMSDNTTAEEACSSNVLERVMNTCKTEAEQNSTTSRTATLWLQYMEMVDILRRFLKAERTGNWELHLQSVYDMLPFFAASGHNLYAKSAYVYLQMMQALPMTHPDVYEKFTQGFHIVRRSDRYWAGLSTDLIIEQVLMRSIKTTGGLTRGKGMTETQRLLWIMSMPACVEVNDAMQELTGIKYETSEQHKEVSKTRQVRDVSDTLELLGHIQQRNPFSSDPTLHSIAHGVVAEASVNVDMSKRVGTDILKSMVGQDVHDYVFKKSKQAITLGSKSAIKISGESVQVDPQLLFQRLVTAGDRIGELPSLFRYELCGYPAALFDASSLPLQANKPALADAIWKQVEPENQELPGDDVNYVLDGGALLHHIPWPRTATYSTVCDMYVDYVTGKYGNAFVVFDGYENGPSTKDATHLRRTGASVGPKVNFSGDMVMTSKKEEFLGNSDNKQRFINMLGDKLQNAGCTVLNAEGDADVLIVKTALESAKTKDTVLVGDDTDLLVLLIHHVDLQSHKVIFAPETKANSRKNRVWDIHKTKLALGMVVCQFILFVHALLGCDTTSRVFGLGKGQALKSLHENQVFQEQATVFDKTDHVDMKNIELAGEKALACLYGATDADNSLDALRYRRFCEKVTTSSAHIQPHVLPPTSAAAKYHSRRVYYQIMEWKGLEESMTPTEWGWDFDDGRYMPKQTDQPPAPKELLEIFRCNCRKQCNTNMCTCRKHGLLCSDICGDCRGTSCANSPPIDLRTD